MTATPDPPVCAAPDPNPHPPARRPPPGSCDTHVHVCGPAARHDYAPDRIYTPPDALLTDYVRVAETLGLERVVFVQPSVYGTDNTVMLDAMRACPLANRGVAVVGPGVSDGELESLDRAGIRGVRFNLVDVAARRAALPLAAIEPMARRIAPLGWHVELLLHVDEHPHLYERLRGLAVEIVVGHLGYFRPGTTTENPGFRALLRLMRAGRCWTKLTGPYRVSSDACPYASARPFAERLIAEAPERLLWGTDWPHVRLDGAMPNDGALLDLMLDWAAAPSILHKILVENPVALYGF